VKEPKNQKEIIASFESDKNEQRLLRRKINRLFGDAAKRQDGQTLAGWRETMKLMARCAQGKDSDLKSAFGVGKMTVLTVMDMGYRRF